MTNEKNPLKVYKASAGSGKTFTLAVEYIKLLIKNPENYRRILAVTFTNKATAEMKERILSQLYGIAHSLADSEKYLEKIKEDKNIQALNLSEEKIRERAGIALNKMMHDYSRFRIETIDSFFQSIVRELAHELNLTANLRVDLNDEEVLHEAVKEIIDSIGDDEKLFKLVFDFVQEKITEGKNWEINKEVERFGKNIFNEQYLQRGSDVRETIGDAAKVVQYKKSIYQLRDASEAELKSLGQQFLDYCSAHSFTKDHFKLKGRGIYPFFEKLRNGQHPNVSPTVKGFLVGAWSDTEQQIQSDTEGILIPILKNVLVCFCKIATVNVISKHLNHLMLINVINNKVRDLNDDANRFLLSDTAHFLRDLIDGSDIPFIYERTGNRFDYIMIDEFQDTSALQWENFKPLISNSISQEGGECLIVGDVKQSIYRWRNSDWEILNGIENGYFKGQITSNSLDTNRRSAEQVILFNNAFFEKAIEELKAYYFDETGLATDNIAHAYSDVSQKVDDKNVGKGYVRVDCFPKAETQVDDEIHRVCEIVSDLVDNKQVKPNEIAILMRTKANIPAICRAFAEHLPHIRIVSDEAYRLDSSPVLQLMIMALQAISNPQNRFVHAMLAYRYQSLVLQNQAVMDDLNAVFMQDNEGLKAMFPKEFAEHELQLSILPLYELTESIYRIFQLERVKEQDAYLFAFFDGLTGYLVDNTTDLDSFLSYWNETMCKQTIPNGEVDGVRIMTIHKSKGLEFHSVIVPFCEWQMAGKDDLLWCEPKGEVFDAMPLMPVNNTKEAKESFFKSDCYQELLKCYVDNLNLIYVAFTRAKNNLYVISGADKNKSVNTLLTTCLEQVSKDTAKKLTKREETTNDEVSFTVFEQGEIVVGKKEETQKTNDEEEKNVLLTEAEQADAHFTHFEADVTFLQSNQSRLFLEGVDEDEQNEQQQRYINEGLLFHNLFSQIQHPDDFESVLRQLECDGLFVDEDYKDEVRRLVQKAFRNTKAREWFDPHWTVMNECSILFLKDGIPTERRPDRVITDGAQTIVIDYKTGRQSEKHVEQVQQYMQLLCNMGYQNVKGYLWYIRREDIVEIEPSLTFPVREESR